MPPPINSSPSVSPSMTTILSLVSSRTYKIVDYVEADTAHLSAPGLGVEFGSTHDHACYVCGALFQGLFLAPSLQYFILHFLAIELLNFLRPANR
jgi:cystathionine beta-lyase family protein involved in aluminum resistance